MIMWNDDGSQQQFFFLILTQKGVARVKLSASGQLNIYEIDTTLKPHERIRNSSEILDHLLL